MNNELNQMIKNAIVKSLEKKVTEERGALATFQIEVQQQEDFTFAVIHAKPEKMHSKMHVYGVYAYVCTSLIYEDSNVIDDVYFKTLQDAKQQAKGYFNHYAEQLNNLK